MKRVLLILMLVLAATPLFAWGEKGHLIVNEAATLSLPTDMPIFFYKAFPQLVWDGPEPDRWKGSGDAIDGVNNPDHFLDYEYVSAIKLPRDRYRFIDEMYKSGTLKRYKIYNSTAGFLPYRIAELCERLTGEWRLWRNSAPGSIDRAAVEADIIRDAGILGHYAADAAQPLHATINFNGWILPNPEGYANDCQIHARFESNFVSRAVSLDDVVPKVMKNPNWYTDYFRAAMDTIRVSNQNVELLYRLDKEGNFALFGPIKRPGVDFTSAKMAAGASLLRDLWWSTWKASEQPLRRRGQPVEE